MRPQSLRRDRQKQFSYMSQEEYDHELRRQIEDKKRQQMQEKVQNQQEILNHYKNYQLGADITTGEDPLYMKDLDALVKNREREIERMGGAVAPMGGFVPRNEVFSGDMNAFAKHNEEAFMRNDKRDLFSDNFVQGYHQQQLQAKNNENLNIINSIFGNANPVSVNVNSASAESERERRLKLREMERLKRQEGFSGGGYGKIEEVPTQPPAQQFTSQTQQNIFGEKPQSAVSRRDQVWQQKMQQRLNSHEGQRQPLHQPPTMVQIQKQHEASRDIASMLPIYQAQGLPPQNQSNEVANPMMMSPDSAVRSSRILNNLTDARKLDQSINLDKPEVDQPPKGYLQLGGDDDLIKKRREHEKRQRQQEYQEFLAKQQKPKPPLPDQTAQNQHAVSVPSSSQSHQRPSHRNESNPQPTVLQNGGLQQLGMHSAQRQEDKARLQKEYRQMLDLQNQQKQQQKLQSAGSQRKQELSDQVFAEIIGSSQKGSYTQVQQEMQPIPYNRENSAPGQNRQDHQQPPPHGLLSKLQVNDDDKKREALEKKREYAMQLQQQMLLKQQTQGDKRRRGTSQVAHQHPQMAIESQVIPVQKQVFEYPAQMMMNAPPDNFNFPPQGYDMPYPQQPLFIQPDQYQHQQQPMLQNAQYQPMMMNQQTPTNAQEPSMKEAARVKQEEYRRELEMQIRLKDGQKRQKQLHEQQIEMKFEQEFQQHNLNQPMLHPALHQETPTAQYQPPSSAPSVGGNNFVRQRTDVSKTTDPQEEQGKMLRQMQYQAELQKQMEEKKRQKEEEKRRKKMEDEEYERKIQKELETINIKDHHELVKEGKRDPNAPYQPPKVKQVRRDQFEPSQDNATVLQKQPLITENRKMDLFGNEQHGDDMFRGFEPGPSIHKGLDLPIHSRREDLFGNRGVEFHPPIMEANPYHQQPSTFPLIQQQTISHPQSEPIQMQQKMMEEQTKMIQMYQQALEQILQFRNQYFEQAMQMRENIIKEREQLLEYEKMKQQQSQEIQQLQAVYNQLGNILNTTSTSGPVSQGQNYQQQQQQVITPILNPQVQNNLNNLIISQKQQIMRMSQSEGFNFKDQMAGLYPQQRYPDHQDDRPTNILEQSLSSETKFVHIPQNKLAQLAGPHLFQTWSQDQIMPTVAQQQNQVHQSIAQSLAGSSHFLPSQAPQKSPQQLSHSKPSLMGLQSRPQTSQPPETIQELPREEDEQVNQSRTTALLAKPAREDEHDFNSRESSGKNSPSRDLARHDSSQATMANNMVTKTNPLGNTSTIQENMLQIDNILKTDKADQPPRMFSPANKTQDKFQNATGSSFYNQTIHHQKQQEQTQMEELQKQLMRIFGNTQGTVSDNHSIAHQMMQKPATPLAQQAQFVNPLQIASINEKVGGVSPEERDILAQSNINIAESVSGTQGMTEVIQKANNKFSSNGFYSQIQYENRGNDDSNNDQDVDYQCNAYQARDYQAEGTLKHDHDVWNDPDLIPPPVVAAGDDEDYYFEPQINQSALNQHSDMNDGTLQNLQMFSPPSVENNYNLASYGEEEGAYDGTMSSQQTGKSHGEFNKSTTKKERDMLEVAKLIQQAANTANNIFELSENFRSKIKHHKDQDPKPLRQNSKKSIKTADPYKNAESKMQNTSKQAKQQTSGINLGIVEESEESKDNDILSNLDKMIMNLQAQQQKYQDSTDHCEDHQQLDHEEQKSRPFSGIALPSSSKTDNNKITPTNNKGSLGKYAQMALQQQPLNDLPQQQLQHQKSQRSVGRFTQMAMQEDSDQNLINEVASKYADNEDGKAMQLREQYMNLQYQQQSILRPVSGKSNSNRYTQIKPPQSQQSQRQGRAPSGNRQQQLFFDEESEEFTGQSANREEQDTSRFNIGFEKQDEE